MGNRVHRNGGWFRRQRWKTCSSERHILRVCLSTWRTLQFSQHRIPIGYFRRVPRKAVRLLTKTLSGKFTTTQNPCVIPAQRNTRNSNRGRIVFQAVRRYCRKNPGIVVVIGGPGARGPSKSLQKYYVRAYGPVKCKAKDDDCVRASILNAMLLLADNGDESHIRHILEEDTTVFINLKPVGYLVHRMKLGFRVQRLSKEENQMINGKQKDAFEWFAKQTSGVFIVRIAQSGKL